MKGGEAERESTHVKALLRRALGNNQSEVLPLETDRYVLTQG